MSGKLMMLVREPEPGRKSSHLVLVSHRGGGWYQARCMGQAKRCRDGACKHSAGLGVKGPKGVRPVKQVPR